MSARSDPELLLELARKDLARERLADAEARCLQVLSAQQHHPGALGVLGQVLYAQARHEEAVRVFNALTVMQPTVAEHWQNLATALRPTKRYDQAIAAFDRALRLAPPSAGLLYNLGVLQMERCDYHAAYLALRDAVALAPADATIRWAFAQCCYDRVNHDEALATLENWQQFTGLTPQISAQIAILLVMMGEGERAAPAIRQLAANPPLKGRAPLVLVCILERLQRLDEAREIMRRVEQHDGAIDADPERLQVSALLASRTGEHEQARGYLSSALEQQRQFPHRYHLLFPLAKALDALGRYDEAYAAAEEAHRSQQAFIHTAMGKSADDNSLMSSRIAHACDPVDIASWGDAGPAVQDSPVFIVGFPRSGTTLLEQVLDAHPLLQSMDEQPFLLRALNEVRQRGIRYPAELGQLSAAALEQLRAHYWDRVRSKAALAPGTRLVDKCPMNMTLLPLIVRLFPNARIILAIRHPCDVLLSCFLQEFRSHELALLCRDLPSLAEAYSAAFTYWYAQWSLLRPSSYELHYEQLTADFAGEVHRLADFLQLPWHEGMLAPAARARAKGFISTPSYAQVLESVNSRSVGRWQRYQRHFSPVLPLLLPWIERLGYMLPDVS
jgi:tetratricopeptide (TPR) repeat protein